MRGSKTVSSSDMGVPVYSGNTSLLPGIEGEIPPARSLVQKEVLTESPLLGEWAASLDKRPFSRPGKRARVQMPARPSQGRPKNVDHDLQALMMSFRSDVDVDVDLPQSMNHANALNHAGARVSASIENDADDLWALLESFDENVGLDSTDILPTNTSTRIPRTDSRLSCTADRAAIPTTQPESWKQADIEIVSTAATHLMSTTLQACDDDVVQSVWQELEGAIKRMPRSLQFVTLKGLLQKQKSLPPQMQQKLLALKYEVMDRFSYQQRLELLILKPENINSTLLPESDPLNPVPNQTIQHISVPAHSNAARSSSPTDMSRHMQLLMAEMALSQPEADRLLIADVLLKTFEGPLRSSVMYTLPMCCDVIRHLDTAKDKDDVSRRIEKIALTEPFYFRAAVMLACVNAMLGTLPYQQPC